MSYALLGNIAFDLINAPSRFDEQRNAHFAEHEVLSGKPKLQASGLSLTEITLAISLHHQLAAVEARYQALIAAKARQEALALVFGLSQFKGHFVITDLSSQVVFTDNRGNVLAREVTLTLREFAGNPQQGLLGKALSVGGNTPLGAMLPRGIHLLVNQTKQVVVQAIQAYRHTQGVINEAKSTIAVMKSLKDNPAQALMSLPLMISHITNATQSLEHLLGSSLQESTLDGINGGRAFFADLSDLSAQLYTVQTLFKQGLNGNQTAFGEWFNLSENALNQAEETSDNLAINAAKVTAWIALRQDDREGING